MKNLTLKKVAFKIMKWNFIIHMIFYSIVLLFVFSSSEESFNIIYILSSILIVILSSLTTSGPILFIYWASNAGIKKVRKDGMSKIDFSKDKGYYRDVLEHYSVLELSYIDNLKNNIKNDVIATLLKLKLKHKIEIKKDEILILDKSTNNLRESELLIFNLIKNGKVRINNCNAITFISKEEALKDELIEKNNDLLKKIKHFTIMLLSIYLLRHLIFIIGEKIMVPETDSIINIILPILVIVLSFLFYFLLFYSIGYLVKYYNSYKRTKKGEEVNIKLEGLKNYIKTFSNLDKRSQEELILWEDYLIYSVMFNINKKIVKDLSNLVEIK